MNELGPKARSLLDAMQEAEEPSARDLARVRAKIDAKLGLAGAAGVAAALSSKAAAGASMGAGSAGGVAAGGGLFGSAALVAGKVVLAVAVTGASVTAGVGVYRESRAVRAAPPAAPSEPLEARVTAPPANLAVRSEAPSATVNEVKALPVASVFESARRDEPLTPRAESSRRARRAPVVLPVDSVEDEAALLASARAAIAQGRAALALERLDEHAVRFPRGALREERRALRVAALCASGKVSEARAAAAAFIGDNPRSPLVGSVRRACPAPER